MKKRRRQRRGGGVKRRRRRRVILTQQTPRAENKVFFPSFFLSFLLEPAVTKEISRCCRIFWYPLWHLQNKRLASAQQRPTTIHEHNGQERCCGQHPGRQPGCRSSLATEHELFTASYHAVSPYCECCHIKPWPGFSHRLVTALTTTTLACMDRCRRFQTHDVRFSECNTLSNSGMWRKR